VPDFDDERLLGLLYDYLQATEALQAVVPQDEPRRTLELAEHKSLAGLALRRRLIELGWTPPPRPASPDPRVGQPSAGQAPAPTSDRDIDV
jgi:hypothetical protein